MKIINVVDVSKEFNNQTVLKQISFAVDQGEIFGYLGPSGAGKTTTIKLLTKQLEVTSGQIEIFGKNEGINSKEIMQNIGLMSDNSGVYEKDTVYNNLKLFCKILEVPLTRIDEVLEYVKLNNDKKTKVEKLSKGMKQRLIIARAILHKPQLLFLDEPTSGLDPRTAKEIHILIEELKNQGMTIFITTHNMEEATKLCDRVAFIYEGELTEIGEPQMLIEKYQETNLEQVFFKVTGGLLK